MDIAKILKYQELTINKEKIQADFKQEKDFLVFYRAQDQKKKIEIELEKYTGLKKGYEEALATVNSDLDDIKKELELILATDSKNLTIDDIDDNLEDLMELKEKAKDYKKQTQTYWESYVTTNRNYSDFEEKFNELMKIYPQIKQNAEALKEKYQQKIAEVNEVIKTVGISDEDKAFYNDRKNAIISTNPKISPIVAARVFVPLDETNGCNCGYPVDQADLKKLDEKGYIQCTNCGKIVYKNV